MLATSMYPLMIPAGNFLFLSLAVSSKVLGVFLICEYGPLSVPFSPFFLEMGSFLFHYLNLCFFF